MVSVADSNVRTVAGQQGALDEIRRRVRNIWGAISSNQVIDKDVEGQAKQLLEYVNDLLRASPSQVAPANPAQGVDALSDRVWRALVLDDPTNITITKDELGAALAAAIGAGGQAVAVWRLPDVETVLSEMLTVATGEHDDGDDDWLSSQRAAVDVWQAAIRAALSQPHPADERVVEALRKARQLVDIATDWNLDEVEIDGEMVKTHSLGSEFDTVLEALSAKEDR